MAPWICSLFAHRFYHLCFVVQWVFEALKFPMTCQYKICNYIRWEELGFFGSWENTQFVMFIRDLIYANLIKRTFESVNPLVYNYMQKSLMTENDFINWHQLFSFFFCDAWSQHFFCYWYINSNQWLHIIFFFKSIH